MANPNLVKIIGVKVPDANIGEYVIIRNLTRGGQFTGALRGSDRSIVFNPAPDLEWQNKDLIQAEIMGRIKAVEQKTIQKGGVQFTLAATADTTTPGILL